jgi:hypothetical protein
MTFSASFRPLNSVSLLPIIGLGILAAIELVSAIVGLGQVLSPDTAIDMDEEGVMSVWLLIQGVVYLLSFPIYIFTIVTFLIWLHRAHSNLSALDAGNLEFTPGWAVGWWFVPFANLVKPFQVVREVWWESNPDADPNERVFLSASLRTAPTYMGVWWAMWIIQNVVANITSRVYDPDTMENVAIGGVLFMVGGVLTAVAAGLAIMVVRDITQRQASRYDVVAARDRMGDLPPPPPVFDRDL